MSAIPFNEQPVELLFDPEPFDDSMIEHMDKCLDKHGTCVCCCDECTSPGFVCICVFCNCRKD